MAMCSAKHKRIGFHTLTCNQQHMQYPLVQMNYLVQGCTTLLSPTLMWHVYDHVYHLQHDQHLMSITDSDLPLIKSETKEYVLYVLNEFGHEHFKLYKFITILKKMKYTELNSDGCVPSKHRKFSSFCAFSLRSLQITSATDVKVQG